MEVTVDRSWVVTSSSSYDTFFGMFVDAVQAPEADFDHLRQEWLERCPFPWREPFTVDLEAIESLVACGLFCQAEATEEAAQAHD